MGINSLVRERDAFWNPFLKSVLVVDAKLTKLGLECRNGKVVIEEPESI